MVCKLERSCWLRYLSKRAAKKIRCPSRHLENGICASWTFGDVLVMSGRRFEIVWSSYIEVRDLKVESVHIMWNILSCARRL